MAIAFPAPRADVLAKRDRVIAALKAIVPGEGVITEENERRAFETDALTSYRRIPMVVVLPETTEQVAAIMALCHAEGVPVVARGAGTSLCGGSIPQEDAVVLGVAKMNRVLDVNFSDRTMRVQAGITNLAISGEVAHAGFFYAPDPSSQLACTIAGNVAMNSGGAHCLKYGVTANNILGLKLVTVEGEIVEIGGGALDAPGYDLIGLLVGSEGQLGVVTEVTVRILARPRVRAPCSSASARSLPPARRSPTSSARASFPWPSNIWTARPSISARPSPRPAIRSTWRPC